MYQTDPSYCRYPEQDPIYRRATRRNISKIGFAVFIYILVIGFLQAAILYISHYFFPQFYNTPVYQLVLQIVPSYVLGFPLFLLLLGGMHKRVPQKHRMSAENWITFLAVAFFLMVIGNLISSYLMTALESLRGTGISNAVSDMISGFSPVMRFIVVVLLAPIVEELMFRKLLIDRLLPYSEVFAVVTSGLIFGLIHGNFYQFFYAMLLGLLFGFVYVKTGNILYTVTMHMIINFTGSVIAGFLEDHVGKSDTLFTSVWSFVGTVYQLALFALALFGLGLLIQRAKDFRLNRYGDQWLSPAMQFSLGWGNAGMISLGALCLFSFITSIFY